MHQILTQEQRYALMFYYKLTALKFIHLIQARLVETGAKKLTQYYTKVVAAGSSGATPTPGSEMMMMTYPSTLIPTLAPVVLFRRTLPLPSTHSSHPAASGFLSTLKEAQKGYADMRGNWSVKCLEGQGKRLVAGAETIDSLTTGRGFTEWVELTLGTSEVCDRQIVCPNSHYLFNRKNTNF